MKKLLPILILLCFVTGARAGFVNISNLTAFPYTTASDGDTLNLTEDITTAGSGINIIHKNVVLLGNNFTITCGSNGVWNYGLRVGNANAATLAGYIGRARVSRLTVVMSSLTGSGSDALLCSHGDYNRFDSCRFVGDGTDAQAVEMPFGSGVDPTLAGSPSFSSSSMAMTTFLRCRFRSNSVAYSNRHSLTGACFNMENDPAITHAKYQVSAPYTTQHNLLLAGTPATQIVYTVWVYGCVIETTPSQGFVMKGFSRSQFDTATVDIINRLSDGGNAYTWMCRNSSGVNPYSQSADTFGVLDCVSLNGTTYAGGRNIWVGGGVGTPTNLFKILRNKIYGTMGGSYVYQSIIYSNVEAAVSQGLRLEAEGGEGALRMSYLEVAYNEIILPCDGDPQTHYRGSAARGIMQSNYHSDTTVKIHDNLVRVWSMDGYAGESSCYTGGYGGSGKPTGWVGAVDTTMLVYSNTFEYGIAAIDVGTSAGQNESPMFIRNCAFRALPQDSSAWRETRTGGATFPTMLLVGRGDGTCDDGGFVARDTGTQIVDGTFSPASAATDIEFDGIGMGWCTGRFGAGDVAVTCSIRVVNSVGNPIANARVHMKDAQGNYVIGSATAYQLTNADGYAIARVPYFRRERLTNTITTIDRNPFSAYAAENVSGGDTSVGNTAVSLSSTSKAGIVTLPNTGTDAFYNGLTVVVDSIANDYSSQLDSIRIRVTTDSRAWPDSFTVSYGTAATYPAYNASTQHFVQAWTASTTFNLWITGFSMYESDTLLLTSRVYDFDSLSPIAQTSRAFMEPPICTYAISADTIDFGIIDSGAVSDIAVQLTNSGGEQIVGTPVVAGSSKFTIQNGGGVFNLTETQSRTVTLRFAPNAPNVTNYATFTFGSSTCLKTYVLKGTATTVAPPPPTPNTSLFKVRIRKT